MSHAIMGSRLVWEPLIFQSAPHVQLENTRAMEYVNLVQMENSKMKRARVHARRVQRLRYPIRTSLLVSFALGVRNMKRHIIRMLVVMDVTVRILLVNQVP